MAHLLLLSGCCEIAGFPRSANCGSEFFPCLSPLMSSPPLRLTCTFPPSPHLLCPSCLFPLTEQWIRFLFPFQCCCEHRLYSLFLCLSVLDLHLPPLSPCSVIFKIKSFWESNNGILEKARAELYLPMLYSTQIYESG